MDSQKKRKEITALIDNIKMHSDRLTEKPAVPILELSVILSKITRLHEKTVVLKYLVAKEQNHEEEEFGIQDIYQEKTQFESDSKAEVETPKEEVKEESPKETVTETANTAEEKRQPKVNNSTEPGSEKNAVDPVKKEIMEDMQAVAESDESDDMPDLNEQYAGDEDPSLSEQLRKQPIADLMTAIGLNERYLYANELFDGDIEAFREAIKTLNDFDQKEKAINYFNEQLMPTHNWQADHDMVKALYLLVERRFQ